MTGKTHMRICGIYHKSLPGSIGGGLFFGNIGFIAFRGTFAGNDGKRSCQGKKGRL
jgi:hypothetical protein